MLIIKNCMIIGLNSQVYLKFWENRIKKWLTVKLIIDKTESQDPRDFVSIFEYNALKQQLREALQEKATISNKLTKVKNDINSLAKLVKSRLFTRLGIPEETFQEICTENCRGSSLKHTTDDNNLLHADNMKIEENKSEGFKVVSEEHRDDRVDLQSSKIYVDKSQYLNSSELPEVDRLATEVFVIFYKIADLLSLHNISEDLLDFELETRDKIGFAITGNRVSFGEGKSKDTVYDVMEHTKAKSVAKSNDKLVANAAHTGNSMQMTTVLSNSKVSVELN